MMRRTRAPLRYASAFVFAAVIVGCFSLGVVSLTNRLPRTDLPPVRDAVRLAPPPPNAPQQPPEPKRPEECKPPEPLPKKFTTRPMPRLRKPILNLSAPDFSPDLGAGAAGGITLPRLEPGGSDFELNEVDEKPVALHRVAPEYPYQAKRNHQKGKVVVRMLVTRDGQSAKISVHSATPKGVFEKAALSAASRWTFRPGKYKGQAVNTWVLVPFTFELTP